MTNTFLVMKTVYGQVIRVKADSISQYTSNGDDISTLHIDGANIDVMHPVDCIDKALSESYYMLKKVELTIEDT